MTNFNPYQAPKADLSPDDSQDNGIRRYGKSVLFIPTGVDLPHRCEKCNAPSRNFVKKTFSYNGYIPLIVFVVGFFILSIIGYPELMGLLLFLVMIISAFTQKKQKLHL